MTFSLVFALILLCGWGGGKLAKLSGIPPITGMLVMGIFLSAILANNIPSALWEIEPFLKNLALIVILLRAGLGINRKILGKIGKTALLMSIIPCLLEGFAIMLCARYLLGFSYPVAGMTGFMLAAVSPAVIIPSMLEIKERGLGKKKEVPTIILAGASVDDVMAITFFSIFIRLSQTGIGANARDFLMIPYSVLGGVLLGLALGYLLVQFLKHYYHRIRATEKTIILLGLCLVLVELGNKIHIASLLGAMTVGFLIYEMENRIAKEIAQKLSKIWIVAEIILFVLIGLSVDPRLMVSAGLKGVAIITCGLLCRSLGVVIATAFSNLNRREKLFCVIAYLPKATVQAALGSVPLVLGFPEGKLILALAVLVILITAPVALFLIKRFGDDLLVPRQTLNAKRL